MKELSLHILDLVQNSITASAKNIILTIDESIFKNYLSIAIKDDGCGISEEELTIITDPFYTTRTTRSVGLGIPMFKMNAEQCGGSFEIHSVVQKGTMIKGIFDYDHIDRAPLGEMANTIVGIVLSLDRCNLIYHHIIEGHCFTLSTLEMRKMLGEEFSLSDIAVLNWVKDYVSEGLNTVRKRTF